MKIKVVIRDERVLEVIMNVDRLPQTGDLIQVREVGEVRVLSAITTRKNSDYQGAVVAVKAEKQERSDWD
jgi:hypothetical protein